MNEFKNIYDTQNEDNFKQAGDLYRLMTEEQKNILVENITNGLSRATKEVQEIMLKQFYAADQDYGNRVQKGL